MKASPTVALLAFLPLLVSADEVNPPPGFKALFNGTDLTGWFGWTTKSPEELWKMSPEELAEYKRQSVEGGVPDGRVADGKTGPTHLKAHWTAENGELVNDGFGLYATTDQDYRDFELWVDYKTVPKADSGIYLRGCPQVQIWDPNETDEKSLKNGNPYGSGGLWNNSAGAPGKNPSKKMDRPFGEWNTFRIRMIGERVSVNFNGEDVVDNAVMENYFDKTRTSPIFAKGPIQLQTHGGEIRWRNIFLHEIDAEEANQILSEGEEGFVRLDNGKDLSNWQGAVDSYEVIDGNIVCKPKKGGDLLSMEEYGDMILRFEFKLPPAGNNGIALRTPLGGHSAADGLEIQVIDSDGYNATHPVPLKDYQYHGSVYHCVGAKHGYLRPVGEWNFEEIEVRGQNIKVTLNGTKILDTDLSKLDRSTIEHPPKGLDRATGHIGFAGHNDPVAFRNFRVKRL